MNKNLPQDKSPVLQQGVEAAAQQPAKPAMKKRKKQGAVRKRAAVPQKPPVPPARLKFRHRALFVSFLVVVVLPILAMAWYLWTQAQDQYVSRVGFTVRREESASAVDIFGGLANLSSSSSSDSDILYEFIQSQEMVQAVNASLDLNALYSRFYEKDAVFSLRPDANIEALLQYWQRMVKVSYTSGTGLIKIEVRAFTPEDAQAIAEEVYRQSTQMINALSAIAREDALKYARLELEEAMEQLKQARQAITAFRSKNQILNPNADIQIQMGLLTSLQEKLGDEMIAHDMLLNNTSEDDLRVVEAKRRIAAISERIRQERAKFGVGGAMAAGASPDDEDYATLLENFESLTVDREFAEKKYTSALSNFDSAQAEAQRQSRYLAAFVRPTLAEAAEYPRRFILLGIASLFLMMGWSTATLIFYSLRDRR